MCIGQSVKRKWFFFKRLVVYPLHLVTLPEYNRFPIENIRTSARHQRKFNRETQCAQKIETDWLHIRTKQATLARHSDAIVATGFIKS